MALKDIFNAKQNREEAERLNKVVNEIGASDYLEVRRRTEEAQSSLNDMLKEESKIGTEVEKLNAKASSLSEQIDKLKAELGEYEDLQKITAAVNAKKAQLLVADDMILMESFALYKPVYSFTTVEEYKNLLDTNRLKQKDMIKNGTAAIGAKGWSVNNSAAQGKKLVDDMIKLCLRSFNNECESAVADVKFNNFDRCKARIEKSAEAIEKLGKMMNISIQRPYINLKLDELSVALEYQNKKQEEKERIKELRAQQREDARIAREIEEARKESLKEQKHYEQALAQVKKQIETCADAVELAILNNRYKELGVKLETISKEMAQIDYREANQRAGYVYVISNIGAFGEGVYKIGMTRRLEPQDRIDELGDASVPFDFDIHALIFSDDAPALEAKLHRTFSDRRLNFINNRREFFRVPLDEIKRVVRENHDKSVEFIDVPPAEQYRESMEMGNRI